jgi:hypothetical protein
MTKSLINDHFNSKKQFLNKKHKKLELLRNVTKKRQQNDKLNIVTINKTSEVPGDVTLRKFRHNFWKRSLNKHQQIIGEIYLRSNLPNIYGDDFKANELRIKLENGIGSIRPYAFVGCPRRWGKTFVTAWFVACALATFPGTRLIVFGPALRQCLFFMEEVKKGLYFLLDENVQFEVLENNKQILRIRPAGQQADNYFHCLPSKENTTRGISANMVIAEELSSIDLSFVLSVIFPLLTVDGTAFAGISTVKGEDNHFNKFLYSYDPTDANSAISVYQFYAACASCRHKGQASSCKHMVSDKPKWIPEDRSSKVKKLYADIGGQAMGDQELSGVTASKHLNAFDVNLVDRIFDKTCIIIDEWFLIKPIMVFSYIDPTGGGPSDIAVVSGVYENGVFVYTGLETITADRPSKCFDQIILHYKKLREFSYLTNAVIYIWVESNVPWTKNEIQDLIKENVPRVKIMESGALDGSSMVIGNGSSSIRKPGAATTATVKHNMWVTYSNHMATNRLKFWENLVSVHHPSPALSHWTARDANRHILKTQLKNYYIQVEPSQNAAFTKDKIAFSGKNKSGTMKDDLAGAAQLLLYWIERFFLLRGNIPGNDM